MSVTLANIAVDCTNAKRLATFWADVLSTEVDAEANEFFATIKSAAGPTLMFLQVPEPRNGKNRLHLDLAATDWAAEVDRIVGLGAKRVDEHNEYGTHWITLADPEGNVFDVADHG